MIEFENISKFINVIKLVAVATYMMSQDENFTFSKRLLNY